MESAKIMKNILIVADIYPPEVSSAAHLMQEFAEGLSRRGHKVTVLTSYPKHYLPKELEGKKFREYSEENGVKIIRAKTLPLKKVHFFIRGISQLVLPYIFFRKVQKYIKGNIDTVIVYSPPLPLALVGKMIKKSYGAKFVLLLEDIFPQNAIDLNILKKKHAPIIWLFERIEKIVYKSADVVTFHSEGGRKFLIENKGIPSEKIVTISNWVDIDQYQNLTEDISFRKKWSLQDKFIFVFAGIMGPAQGMQFIINVARKVTDLKDVVFLLVGDGMEKAKIENLIQKYDLKNVLMKSFISKDEYPYLVKDSDVGMVCLSADNKTPFIPGKFLGYMASGTPVLAFLNKESDGFGLIEKAKCGYAVVSDDAEGASQAVKKFYNDRANIKEMGDNGLLYARSNLSLEVCLDKFEKIFNT